MGVKLGLSPEGKNVDLGPLRTEFTSKRE